MEFNKRLFVQEKGFNIKKLEHIAVSETQCTEHFAQVNRLLCSIFCTFHTWHIDHVTTLLSIYFSVTVDNEQTGLHINL